MSFKSKRQVKGKMAEECCFVCKDSWSHDLRVCDSRNCLKAYHPGCVQNKGERFICDLHICFRCRGRSDYQCLCCPVYSVCSACLGKQEFVQLRKQNKGFCSTCLNLAIAIEKNDPHVAETDKYEILFKDYWERIKDAEHLTLVDLEEASDILNRKLSCKGGANLERFPADDHKSDENTSPGNGANGQTIPFDSKGKQIKANTSVKNKSNKRTYVGWGSKELIEFLSSLGKDTSKPLDELEIIGVVKGYIKQKKLYKDDKKLCFLCDDKLQPLFTRRKVKCKMIRKFLAVHLASTSNDCSEDDRFFSYNEDDDNAPVIKKRPLNSLEPKITKRVSERSKRHFASLTQSNINLIYLRRSLVASLLNQPHTFEQKVVGCFVKVRSGKMENSYERPKKPYLLGQVTGIEKSKEEYTIKIKDTCISTNILLCVTGLLDDVSISMLSDEDLEEDECNDLVSLAEKGLLKRTTVAEMEEKVATVHRDIVNHWIERELVRIGRKITNKQMKGLLVELGELLDQEKLLNTPAERQRLLEEVPEIDPDTEYREKETELQVAASNSSQENRGAAPAHQVVDSLNVLNGESSKGTTEQIHDCLDLRNKELSEVASKQGDATREEADPGVDRSAVGSDGSEEERDADEETVSVRTSRKRGAQSSSETNEPKKPRVSEERALLEAKFADHPRLVVYRQEPPAGLSFAEPPNEGRQEERALTLSSPVAAIGPSPPRRQGPIWQEGEDCAVEMPPGEPTVKGAPSSSCLDSVDVEARLSPRPWPVADVGDGPPPGEEELSAELASAERALREARSEAERHESEARRTEQELADVRRQLEDAQAQRGAALEDVGRLERERDSAAQAAVEESARLLAQLEELRRGKAASDAAAKLKLQVAAEERRRREQLSAALASAERALREARSEAERHVVEAAQREQRALELAKGRSKELADVRRQLEDAQAQLERARDSGAQAAQTAETARQASEAARQAAVEESERLVVQLEELRRGKAASDAAARESARRASDVEAERESSERARQVAEAGLIGLKELISRLNRQFSSSIEVRSKLQADLKAMTGHIDQLRQLAAAADDHIRKDGSRVFTRQLHQLEEAVTVACHNVRKAPRDEEGEAGSGLEATRPKRAAKLNSTYLGPNWEEN